MRGDFQKAAKTFVEFNSEYPGMPALLIRRCGLPNPCRNLLQAIRHVKSMPSLPGLIDTPPESFTKRLAELSAASNWVANLSNAVSGRFADALNAALGQSVQNPKSAKSPDSKITLITALSGGPDSTALALLADDFARARGYNHHCIVIDHALRPRVRYRGGTCCPSRAGPRHWL